MPTITPVHADAAPKAIGPYSQALVVNRPGRLVFCSGQTPIDPATGELVAGGVTEQTHQVFRNVTAVLTAAGGGLNNVVKTTVFLRTMGDFAAMNAVYAGYFGENPPARSTVAVAGLPKDCSVEIECLAVLD